jgi:hypothetical protein
LLPLTDGSVLVGGTFSSVNGVARSNLVKLNGDGNLAAAPPRFRFITVPTADQVSMTLDVVPGRNLILQTSTNLVDWVTLPAQPTTTYLIDLEHFDADGAPRRFYRAMQSPR